MLNDESVANSREEANRDPNGSNLQFQDGFGRIASFAGADFVVMGYSPEGSDQTIVEFANLQTLSISTTRDVSGKRVLGTSWVEEFSMGNRTVAGSLVFTLVDGDALQRFRALWSHNNEQDVVNPLPDAIPPFNVILSGSNEYGTSIAGALLGVQLVNSGIAFGVQDSFTEQTFSYVARRYIPLRGTAGFKDNLRTFINQTPELKAELNRLYGRSDPFWTPPALPAMDLKSIERESKEDVRNQRRREENGNDILPLGETRAL